MSTGPPTMPIGPPTMSLNPSVCSKPRSRYVPPPGIHSSSSSGNLAMPAFVEAAPPSSASSETPSLMMPESASSMMHGSSSVPDFATMNPNAPELYPGQHSKIEQPQIPDEPLYHWYYKMSEKSHNVLNPA